MTPPVDEVESLQDEARNGSFAVGLAAVKEALANRQPSRNAASATFTAIQPVTRGDIRVRSSRSPWLERRRRLAVRSGARRRPRDRRDDACAFLARTRHR